jgi:pimeloyl-ACP methyl ester carboxylesterase
MSPRVSIAKPTIALVHGCTQGPSCWDRVRAILSSSGISTVAIDLDPDHFATSGATQCAGYIAEMLEGDNRVVLVGTSCTGIIVPVVAMLRPIEHLVYVSSGLPDIGRSVRDQITYDDVLHEAWATWPGEPGSDEAARRFMFHDCDPADLEWSLTTVRSFLPRVAYEEITPLTAWPSVQSSYILGRHDRIVNQEWARQVVPTRLGIEPRELETGHCPQNSRPELLAEILLEIVDFL